MFGRPPFSAGRRRSQVIDYGIQPGIANQVKIWIFINYGYQILFYIPAVAKDDDILLFPEFRHNLPDHVGGQLQFRFRFLSHTVTERDSEINHFLFVPNRDAEHQAYKTVSIQIIGAIVGSMIKQFGYIFKLPAKL